MTMTTPLSRVASRRLLLGLALLGATLASPFTQAQAQGRVFGLRPPAASSGPPGRFLDEASLEVQLNTGGSSEGYKFRATVRGTVHGRGISRADALSLEYKVGARTIATVRCPIDGWDGFRFPNVDGYAVVRFSCQTEQVIDSAEDATLQLTYHDDEDDRVIPFRPLRVRVGASPVWGGGTNWRYMNYANDHGVLGSSTIWLRQEPFGDGYRVMFTFWANPSRDQRRPNDVSLRCSRNGERLRENISVSGVMMHGRGGNTADYTPQVSADGDEYGFTYYELATGFAYDGRGGQGDRYDLAANPGEYMCEVRVAGTPVRQFLFTVRPDGSVPPHPEQLGSNPLYLTPGRVLVDTRFPTPTAWDHGIDPDAIRAGAFFGRPWRDAASVAGMLGALPTASVGALDGPAVPTGATAQGFSRPVATAGRGGSSRGGSASGSSSGGSSMTTRRR